MLANWRLLAPGGNLFSWRTWRFDCMIVFFLFFFFCVFDRETWKQKQKTYISTKHHTTRLYHNIPVFGVPKVSLQTSTNVTFHTCWRFIWSARDLAQIHITSFTGKLATAVNRTCRIHNSRATLRKLPKLHTCFGKTPRKLQNDKLFNGGNDLTFKHVYRWLTHGFVKSPLTHDLCQDQ